jgi:hypothetical protein
MKKKIEQQDKLFHIHKIAFQLWKKTNDPQLDELCHTTLHQILQHLPASEVRVQSVMLKNCFILAYRKDFTPIEELLNLFHISLQNDEDIFIPLVNRLRLLLA